ncbi:augmin complex subunit dgt5 [Topomyia yanbarensis]|uniref:augmin complex subunit dgt5 n=1 Tax=Topomyia yanbarensis TaxID=2498891 RepID=UPI00273BDC3D|nr:augmin complex subunit dgt5 [Topomyia yanbarensis]
MASLDEVAQFKVWATRLGCPLEKIPPDEILKKYIRGKESILFQQIMKAVRPRQEIATMRNNVLVSQLKHYRSLGSVVAQSKLNQMPEELRRFEKVGKLKAKCAETKGRIMSSINALNSVAGKIKEKNIQKVSLATKLREADDKLCFHRAVNNYLAKMSTKEVEIKETIDHLMPVKIMDSSKTKIDAENAIKLCLKKLQDFYSKFSEFKQEGCKQAQQVLWANLKTALKGIPNYYLWSVLMEMKEKQLLEISEADRQQNEFEKNTTLSDQDMLQVNMAKLCGSHINLFIDLVSMKHSVQSLREDYLTKYTPFSQMLESKMNLLNVMDDEADAILEDYMLQSTTKDYNQGQLELINKEIERKKQEIKIQTKKLENHEQLLAQLREIYNEIDSYSEKIQEEIQLLNQIKEKITYFKRFSRYTVHNMRQKTANQTMNLSEQSLNLTRLESKSISHVPVYSPATLPPYRNELALLADIPFSKFNRSSKIPLFSMDIHICLLTGREPSSVLSLLPNCFSSAEMSLQAVRAVIKFDECLRSFTQDIKPEMDTVALDDQHYRQLWATNHEKICELLDEIEAISGNTKQVIGKSRVYYNFVLSNALRKFVPPKKLFNGRNYREYECEYMMYYRMINGTTGEN